MTIYEFADSIDCSIYFIRLPNGKTNWFICEFRESLIQIKGNDKNTARPQNGTGDSPESALKNYVELIRGKILVIFTPDRKELEVPYDLTV